MTQITSVHHSFDINLATKYGVHEAILIHHFQHWIRFNKIKGKNHHDGRTWTYQSREDLAIHFPYMNANQIRRLTDKLVKYKVLMKGNYNKSHMDKTIWYAFENEEEFSIGKFATSTGKNANGVDENAKAIPDTKPDTKPDKDTSLKVSSDKSAESAKASEKKKIVFNKEVTDLCESLLSEMRKVKPDYKFSKTQAHKWCEQVDLMLRLDKRDSMTILELLRWALGDNFWKPKLFKPNPAKYLREKFDQLEMQMRTPKIEKTYASKEQYGETPQQAEWARINTKFFYDQKAESGGALDHCFIKNGFLNNSRNRTKDASIKVHPDLFARLIETVSGAQYCGL